MEDLLSRLDTLETKVYLLLAKNKLIKEENELLKTKITQLTSEQKKLENDKSIEPKNQDSLFSIDEFKVNRNPTDTKKIKKEIEQAIRYIDDCIEWIQKY